MKYISALLIVFGVSLLAIVGVLAQDDASAELVLHTTADHSQFEILQGTFATGPDVTAACLTCHNEAAQQVMATEHWTWLSEDPETGEMFGKQNIINNYCVAIESNEPRCTSCHRAQSFCVSCHQRAGVTLSGPYGAFAGRGRFHPPKSVWTDPPRTAGHHAWEAERNIEACVSCHVERDCAICHASTRVGGRGPGGGSMGQGTNPHPVGFQSRCRTALRKNARPCLVCHDPADPQLLGCR